MRISDWSSDVCSSDLQPARVEITSGITRRGELFLPGARRCRTACLRIGRRESAIGGCRRHRAPTTCGLDHQSGFSRGLQIGKRSEEHTSELPSLMRISYAVFCLKKKTTQSLYTH